jgi:hypothetical protein
MLKWFKFESDAPNDMKLQALARKASSPALVGLWTPAQSALGSMFLVWAFVAHKGKREPGEGVRADGSPLDPLEMAVWCNFGGVEELAVFLDSCAVLGLIDRQRWEQDRVVYLPAMASRADEYTQKKRRRAAKAAAAGSGHNASDVRIERWETPEVGDFPLSLYLDQSDQEVQQEGLPLSGMTQAEELMIWWNTNAPDVFPRVSKLTKKRAVQYGEARKVIPLMADWDLAGRYLWAQKWTQGLSQDRPGWKADLDYFTRNGGEKCLTALERARAKQATQPAATGAAAGRTQSSSGRKYSDV